MPHCLKSHVMAQIYVESLKKTWYQVVLGGKVSVTLRQKGWQLSSDQYNTIEQNIAFKAA